MKGKWQSVFEAFENFFDVTWHWKQQTFACEWKRIERDVFFRPRGEDVRFVWHIRLPSYVPISESNANQLVQVYAGALGWAWRFYCIDDTPILLHLGSGLVFCDHANVGRGFKLDYKMFKPWFDADKHLFGPQDFIEEQLALTMNEPNSQLRQAKQWVEEYRDDFSFMEMKHGNREHLQQLLHGLTLLFPFSWNAWRGTIHPFERFRNCDLRVRTSGHNLNCSRLVFSLNEHFCCRLTPRILIHRGVSWKRHYQLPTFPTTSPSHHERLEALLLWRDFLRDKLPPDEIEALLQPHST